MLCYLSVQISPKLSCFLSVIQNPLSAPKISQSIPTLAPGILSSVSLLQEQRLHFCSSWIISLIMLFMLCSIKPELFHSFFHKYHHGFLPLAFFRFLLTYHLLSDAGHDYSIQDIKLKPLSLSASKTLWLLNVPFLLYMSLSYLLMGFMFIS